MAKGKQNRYTDDEKRKWITLLKESGLSVTKFAEKNPRGPHFGCYYQWLREPQFAGMVEVKRIASSKNGHATGSDGRALARTDIVERQQAGRSRAIAERRAQLAAIAANIGDIEDAHARAEDGLIFLQQGKADIYSRIRSGELPEADFSHLCLLLAELRMVPRPRRRGAVSIPPKMAVKEVQEDKP